MFRNLRTIFKEGTLIFVVLIGLFCSAQTQNFLEKPYLETNATYTAEVLPDRIYLQIEINEKDTKGKVPIEALENKMVAKLTGLGIDVEKQLSVSDLTSDFQKYFLRKTDVLKNKEYTLLVYDAPTASRVSQELESINISNIAITKTTYSKLEEFKIELKAKAIEKAKRQAVAMLTPLGQEVGKALFVSDSESSINSLIRSYTPRGSNQMVLYSSESASVLEAEIGIQEIRVQVAVIVYFEIL